MITEQLKTASDSMLKSHLSKADPMVLRGLVYHATGDEMVANLETTRVPGLFAEAPWMTDPASLNVLQQKAFELLQAYRDGTRQPPSDHPQDRLLKAMTLVADEQVPATEFDFWFEELAVEPARRQLHWDERPTPKKLHEFTVLVIGAGLGGVNAAIQLELAGFNYQVIDKNAGVGGTWYQNKYPGARVDLPSRIYSHSFAMDYHFDHPFAPQEENEKYVNWLVDKFGVRDRIRFNSEVVSLRWLEDSSAWEAKITGSKGEAETLVFNAVVCAVGFLDRPSIPTFQGMDEFKGSMFHTTNFDPTLDLADKNVSVIGTGASGMQMVPDLLPLVRRLSVFQRSPGWVLHLDGYRDPYSAEARWLHRNVPYYAHWTRFGQAWAIGDHVIYNIWSVDPNWTEPNTLNADNFKMRERLVAFLKQQLHRRPDLIGKVLPKYPPLSKRYVMDNGWFDAIQKDNCELIADDPIDHFTENSLVTKSGKVVPTDVVVFATGFRANEYFWPMEVRGRGGVSVDEVWSEDGARAFWGINVKGLPNFFCVYGPNTNPKNTGPVPYGEYQIHYILKCLQAMLLNDWKSLEVRADVFDEHNKIVDERNAHSIFLDKRQKSYYTNEFGRSAVASPWATIEYWAKLREPDFGDYIVQCGSPREAQIAAR